MTDFAPFLTLLGWTFLPRFASGFVLKTYYSYSPKHKPTSPQQAAQHARYAHLFVVTAYLCYTLYGSYMSLAEEENFYDILNLKIPSTAAVSSEQWDKTIRSRWRSLARQFHPDKLQGNVSEMTKKTYEYRYVRMRRAYETLSEPLTKLAYDRFGWAVVHACEGKCTNASDFMLKGLQASLGFYAAALFTLIGLSVLRRSEFGTYWRYVSLIAMFGIELQAVTQPEHHTFFLSRLFFLSDLTTNQHILLMHQLFLTFNSAIAQIGPVLFPSASGPENEEDQVEKELLNIAPFIARMDQLSTLSLQESERMFFGEVDTVLQGSALPVGDEYKEEKVLQTLDRLKHAMVHNMTEMKVRSTPEGQAAWMRAVAGDEEIEVKSESGSEAGEVVVKAEEVDQAVEGQASRSSAVEVIDM